MTEVPGLISVVIPVYNVEAYLPECIDSVLHQTYDSMEVVLIDDGSLDSSPQICDRFSRHDSRITVIHQENKGPSAARNAGLSVAQGQFVYFLDSDDYLADDALMELQAEAQQKNADVVLFDGKVIDEQGNVNLDDLHYVRRGTYHGTYDGRRLFAELKSNSDYRSAVPFLFIRRRYLDDINLSFRHGIVHEDELFTFLLLMQCKRAVHLPRPLYYRRVRAGSIMSTLTTGESCAGLTAVIREMLTYRRDHDLGRFDDAAKKHIGGLMKTALFRYYGLSREERKRILPHKNEILDIARGMGYLDDWRLMIWCNSWIPYGVYRSLRLRS